MSGAGVADRKTVFQALSSNARLRMLDLLGGQPDATVTELAGVLGLSQPLLSWHLSILRRAGLVCTRREGRVVRCSLVRDRFRQIGSELLALAGDRPADDIRTHDVTEPFIAGTPVAAEA